MRHDEGTALMIRRWQCYIRGYVVYLPEALQDVLCERRQTRRPANDLSQQRQDLEERMTLKPQRHSQFIYNRLSVSFLRAK